MSKMSKKRILITLAVMAVMLSLAAAPAMAQSELDQSQPIINQSWIMQEPDKQTFTAQRTGTLDLVTIYVQCGGFACNQDVGGPVLTVEFSGSQSDPSFGYTTLDEHRYGYDIPLDPAPFVEAGKQYEIKLSLEG